MNSNMKTIVFGVLAVLILVVLSYLTIDSMGSVNDEYEGSKDNFESQNCLENPAKCRQYIESDSEAVDAEDEP